MRYALTYMNGNSFGEIDTIIVEADPRWFEDLSLVQEVLETYGLDKDDATYVTNKGMFFVRNCDDIDYDITTGKEQ